MSHFGENITVRKTVLVSWYGSNYTTAKGLAGVLAEYAATRILETHSRNTKKYGSPRYSKPKELAIWKAQKSRLRKKFSRRIMPIMKKLFEENVR